MKKLIRASQSSYVRLSVEDVCKNLTKYIQNCWNTYLSTESKYDHNYSIKSKLDSGYSYDTASGPLDTMIYDVDIECKDSTAISITIRISFLAFNNQFVGFDHVSIFSRFGADRNGKISKSRVGPDIDKFRFETYTIDEVQEKWNNSPRTTLEELLPDSYLYEVFAEVESKYEFRYGTAEDEETETSNMSWKSLRSGLLKEMNNGVDPLYEETKYGSRLLQVCSDVENHLGLLLEPSVQGGWGSIFVYDKNTEDLISEIDFERYNETILNNATNTYTEQAFKVWYKSFLESLIK